MLCCDLLEIKKGAVALIGGGGKTTLMYTLAGELAGRGSVIVTTTTHIRCPERIPVFSGESKSDIKAALSQHKTICVGADCGDGKLSAPKMSLSGMLDLADYVIIEADGSKGLPFKAHAAHEPVAPAGCAQTILVVGVSGFGKPIKDAAHRPELYAKLAGCGIGDIITPKVAAAIISTEGLHTSVFINQTETDADRKNAQTLTDLLDCRVYGGALMKGEWECLR